MKNLAGLMKQAQEVQSRMEETKARLDAAETEGSAGAGLVRLVLSGSGALRRIAIDPKLLDGAEAEMLEDLILAAHKDAKTKADAAAEVEMQKVTGGLNLPAGLKLPF